MKSPHHFPVPTTVSLKKALSRNALLREPETFLFVVASTLDLIMTCYLLSHQQIHFAESNPVARFFIDGWGLKGLIVFKASIVLFIVGICEIIGRLKLDVARHVLYFSTMLVSAVVIYSVLLLGRATGAI